MKFSPVFFALVALVAASSAEAGTINVPADQPTIQAAIDAANNGDTVLVAPGTYFEKLDFLGKAITVKSSGSAAGTILDGNGSGPLVSFHSSEGNTSVLEGFTLTHAQSTNYGSAVYISQASPTIIGNIFVDNTQAVGLWGAAIGGNVASPVVIGNLFSNNACDSQFLSGVVVVVNTSAPTIVNNVFLNNSCRAVNVTLPTGNKAYVSNNTFAGNPVGIRVDARVVTSAQVYRNNILFDNIVGLEVDFGSAANYPTWKNNLVFGSTTADYQGIPDQTDTSGNISSDPRLKDWIDGDVHMLYGSPAIDAGDMSAPTLPTADYYGNTRIFAGNPGDSAVVDIGAAEYQPPLVAATDGSAFVPFGTATNGRLGSANADPGEPLVFDLDLLPAHGSVRITDAVTGAFQYVPARGYLGTDSFTFHITDPYGAVSNTATEQVTVAHLLPTANDGSVSTTPDRAVTGTLSATGETLTFRLVSKPAHGTLSLNVGSGLFRYTPARGFAGADSFTFEVTDVHGVTSNIATESVTVTDIAPTAYDANVIVPRSGVFRGFLRATAAYFGQALNYGVASNPAHGTVTIINAQSGAYRYRMDSGYRGKDSFTIQVVDQWGTASNVARVSISVF